MDVYNKMSASYDKLYKRNILNFQDILEPVWQGDGWFVDFYPSLGIAANEACDLLFYGQAVNGWVTGFDLYGEITKDKISHSILSSNRYFKKQNHSPLDWVNVKWSNSTFNLIIEDPDARHFYTDGSNYRTFRSFFWKVVFKLTSDFYGLKRESFDWSKKIVWSNLYKIAEDGVNPNSFLREQQFPTSLELLRKEIEELKPKYCIVLTNYKWWEPFKINLKSKNLMFDKTFNEILSFEQYNDTKIIVTTRPKFGNGENHVQQLLKIMKK